MPSTPWGIMETISITFETIFDLLRRERSREELQKLSPSFYLDVMHYIREKKMFLEAKPQRLDFFSGTEREKMQQQLMNIKKMIREFYDKRESKILKMAVIKAMTNSSLIDTSCLLDEERQLYEDFVFLCTKYRQGIVVNLLEGMPPEISGAKLPSMPGEFAQPEPFPQPNNFSQPQVITSFDSIPQPSTDTGAIQPQEATVSAQTSPEQSKTKMVRFVNPVPQFVGKELELYGPFDEDDMANLPEEIADILVKKGRAEEMQNDS